MSRPQISVTIITLNEEHNLARALASVQWADDILVVDSGSTDRTAEIARGLGARLLTNPWQGYGQQKNFAQDFAKHDWILNLDADEEVPPSVAAEIQAVAISLGEAADSPIFSFPRKTFYLGRWIRYGGWYPNHVKRLYNKKLCRWSEPEVHETLVGPGPVIQLRSPLHHYTFVDIADQIETNLQYARKGARELRKRGKRFQIISLLLKPIGKFIETFVLKRGFMDGTRGFIISVNAAHSIFLKYAHLLEHEIDHARTDR